MLSNRFRLIIEHCAAQYNLDPDVVQGVIEQESSGRWFSYRYEPMFFGRYLQQKPEYRDRDPREVSASYGLMQVMYSTAIENGFAGEPWDLFKPEVAIDLGCRHLSKLVLWARKQYTGLSIHADAKILRAALAAYNGGKVGNAPDDLPDRNSTYADSVLSKARIVKMNREQD